MLASRWQGVSIVLGASVVLLVLASRFDFFCDDAFIVLRYAENLARHGAPVYNLGERVEGYTSFTWMLLGALGATLDLPLPRFVQWMGALSGVGLLAASWAVWRRMQPEHPGLGAVALGALAFSAPLAAWTMGGLETPLFAALATAAFALATDLLDAPRRSRGWALGTTLALCTLTRPEGALVAVAIAFPLVVALGRSPAGRAALGWLAVTAGGIVGAHLIWRLSYYGYPLPNTFYVKSSGNTSLLRLRGFAYVALASRELGIGVLLTLAFGLVGWRSGAAAAAADPAARARWLLLWAGRLLVPAYVLYVIAVGGDFLDLYRFFVPLLPLCFLLAASALASALPGDSRGRAIALAIAVTLLGLHAHHQHGLAERAKQVKLPALAERGIEPLGWTRLYARRWAALGRWIALHARSEDWMAVGAAGAMPYYAGIRNLDTFGLCDAWVAHHAPVVGNRPGHQRFAPEWYILSKQPVFLLIGSDYSSDTPRRLRSNERWAKRGYMWVEARVDSATFGAPSDFYHYLLMRSDRIAERANSRWLRARD